MLGFDFYRPEHDDEPLSRYNPNTAKGSWNGFGISNYGFLQNGFNLMAKLNPQTEFVRVGPISAKNKYFFENELVGFTLVADLPKEYK
jgi:hypothetical protein